MKNDFFAFCLICVIPGMVFVWLINLISFTPPNPVKPREVVMYATNHPPYHLQPNTDLRPIYGWKNPYNVQVRK